MDGPELQAAADEPGAEEELSIVRVARAEHDANTERSGEEGEGAGAIPASPRPLMPDSPDSAGLAALEAGADVDREHFADQPNRFMQMAERVSAMDDELARLNHGDASPSAKAKSEVDAPTGNSDARASAAHEIARLKQEETETVKVVLARSTARFYSTHRMHRTYLLHCFRDERLKIAPQRLGVVLGSVAADWVGMTDNERTLRSDFEMRNAEPIGVLSGHAGGAHGLRHGSTRNQMAELNQITRGVQAFVRVEGPLAQRARREALAAGDVGWYPCGGERLVLTMSDLELAVQDVLKDTPFQLSGVSKKQAALMMCQHPDVLLLELQRKFFPVKMKDVIWMMKHSVRHWLRVAAEFEPTDYEADRMRQIARNQRDETRKAWEAARARQNEAMQVVHEAQRLQKESDELQIEAQREREEMAQARLEMAREKMEVRVRPLETPGIFDC